MSYDPNSLEGVPADARGRLAQNKAGLFTSDLSVREFLLVKEAASTRSAWSSGARSTTSGSSSRTGTRTRRWTSSRRPCTTPASWR